MKTYRSIKTLSLAFFVCTLALTSINRAENCDHQSIIQEFNKKIDRAYSNIKFHAGLMFVGASYFGWHVLIEEERMRDNPISAIIAGYSFYCMLESLSDLKKARIDKEDYFSFNLNGLNFSIASRIPQGTCG